MHMFVGSHKNNIKLDGYINTGLLDPFYIRQRHDDLVDEMIRRGYNHKSPIDIQTCEDIADTYCQRGLRENVNAFANTEELRRRCKECNSLIEDAIGASGFRATT